MSTTTDTGPTLTQITYVGRQVVKFGLLTLVTLMVSRLAIGAFVSYWKATHPPPPPPPTVGFGVLPAAAFPAQTAEDTPSSYKLETADGKLPEFSDRAKVYFMPKKAPSLLADQEAKALASKLGFVFEPEVLGNETYRWSKNQPFETTIDFNIRTYHFELSTDFENRPELLINSQLPTNFEAVREVRNMLNAANLVAPDIATPAGDIVPLKSLGGELTEAVSVSDADFLRVDLNRTPIDNQYRMFTPEGYKGVISAIITGGQKGRNSIVSLDYNYNRIDYTQVHTYPIKTSRDAWRVLQAGEGFIVNKGSSDPAVVRNVQLGYYDDFEEQEYLQPIYVFTGDDGFLGYVPAITNEFLQSN